MDSNLRFAWTEVVTAEDYDAHMAAIGQAQAAAALTDEIVRHVDLPAGSRVIVIGAGTGQMFDYMNAAFIADHPIDLYRSEPEFSGPLEGTPRAT